jgi:sugar lactone lactonase YvrE
MNTLGSVLTTCAAFTFAAASTVHAQPGYEPRAFGTLAGVPPGNVDGTGAAARFQYPRAVATDSAGNVYVADTNSHTIRKVTPDGAVTTFAGLAGQRGNANGQGNAARFAYPSGVATNAGILYVADPGNGAIRKITADGTVSTFVGGSLGGLAGIALDASGNIYITQLHTVRKITPTGQISTLAGSSSPGFRDGQGDQASFDNPDGIAVTGETILVADTQNHAIRYIAPDGYTGTLSYFPFWNGSEARLPYNFPRGLAVDSAAIYVADTGNRTIRKITVDGAPHVAGSALSGYGSADGNGTAARLLDPAGLTFDGSGNLIVADAGNATIRKISPSLDVSTLAGRVSPGHGDGAAGSARFGRPTGVVRDAQGNVYVADTLNHTIRKVTPAGIVSTFAGMAGEYGEADGNGSNARFRFPTGVAVDPSGNVYVADWYHSTIRKITPARDVSTVAVLSDTGIPGGSPYPAAPEGLAVDSSGTIYVAGTRIHAIIKISPSGEVSTFAGSVAQPGSTDGTGPSARFRNPFGVAVDSSGNVYVADTGNQRLRKITPAAVVSTLPTGQTRARGVAVDAAGNLYFPEWNDAIIRKLTPAGQLSTLAGLAVERQSADGVGSAARFSFPVGIAIDAEGKLYVADTNNNTIRVGELPLVLTSAVSRKPHGSAGPFDINLPLPGGGLPGVECRTGDTNGNHTLVFTFNHNIASANAAVSGGVGTVAGNSAISNNQVSVDLTGVTNAQTLTVTLTGVTDALGQALGHTAVSVSFLQGDTNGNGSVNATDIGQTKAASGQTVTTANFRADVSANGSINATDIGIVKSSSGTSLPAASADRTPIG